MRTMPTIMAMLGAALLLLPSSALAQATCPEGRTLSGTCVKPDLAQSLRKSTILNTQPKFSFTSPPVLPSEDYDNRPLPDFKEIFTLFGTGSGRR